MKLRKFALLVLACSMVYGFSAHPASASAETTVSETEDITVLASPEVSSEVSEAPQAALLPEPTLAPVSTAAPVQTSKPDSKTAQTTKKSDTNKKDTKKASTSKKAAKKASYTKAELRLMASIINCEAGGECFQGKLAVGIVVMNRVKSKAFPNTIKGVIYQKYQFSPVRNGSLHKRLLEYDKGQTGSAQWKSCILAAKKTLAGQTTIIRKGKVRSMKGIHFFSVVLPHAKFKLGGHRFK